jgi:hypothetical protein
VLDPARWWAPAAWLACQATYPPLLLAFTPGLVLVPRREGADPLVRGVEAIGASLSFWMAAFWLLRWLPAPLEPSFQAVSAAAVLAHALWPRPAPTTGWRERVARLPWAGLAAAAVLVALRLLPMNADPAPAGADMSMHAYLAEMIVRADGVPTSYRPIWPIDTFGTFPVGFSLLTALVSTTADLPLHRAAFAVTGLSHAFVTAATFALLRPRAGAVVAGIAAFALTFSGDALQGYVGWGGNPTVLAIALAALLLASLLRLPDWRDRDAAFAGLLLAGVALTHTIVLVQSFYLMGVPLLAWLAWRGPRDARTLRSLAIFGASFAVIAGPYLVGVDPGLLEDEETRAWLQHWVRHAGHVWNDNLATAPVSIPTWALDAVGERLALFVPLAALGLPPLRRRDPRAAVLVLAFLGVAFLLVLNARLWWLPLSPLVYPERVAAMLLLPFGLAGVVGLDVLLRSWAPGWRAPAAAFAVALVVAAGPYQREYLEQNSRQTTLRSADLRALAWLDRHAAPDDVIETQYGDAGLWVPALLFRPVTAGHVNVAHLSSLELPKEGRFRYLGARCVYSCTWSLDAPPDPAVWREVHADGAARVYERRVPGAAEDAPAGAPASGEGRADRR